MIDKANKMSNVLYSVLGRSCNRMLIGKNFWKGMALPYFLYGQEAILYNKGQIQKLQLTENKAFRTILQVPLYTPIEALRGEIGSSSMEYRDIKNKILYLRNIMKETPNELIRKIIIEEINQTEMKWIKLVKSYMSRMRLSIDNIVDMTPQQLKDYINRKESEEWREGMNNKSSLALYKDNKKQIDEVKWFRNGIKWNIMVKARTNTLKLGWRNWETEMEKKCEICEIENEDLKHFLLECTFLEKLRCQFIELQRPRNEDINELMARILLFGWKKERYQEEQIEYFVDMVFELWKERERLRKAATSD